MLFNKREMKLIDYKNAQKNLLNGISVYLVQMDGSEQGQRLQDLR